jgi:hypothetical protein
MRLLHSVDNSWTVHLVGCWVTLHCQNCWTVSTWVGSGRARKLVWMKRLKQYSSTLLPTKCQSLSGPPEKRGDVSLHLAAWLSVPTFAAVVCVVALLWIQYN